MSKSEALDHQLENAVAVALGLPRPYRDTARKRRTIAKSVTHRRKAAPATRHAAHAA